MNKIYKIVWNIKIGTWIVVSELAKSKLKVCGSITNINKTQKTHQTFFKRNLISLAILFCLGLSGAPDRAFANNIQLVSNNNLTLSPKVCTNVISKGNLTQYSIAIGCFNKIKIDSKNTYQSIYDHRKPVSEGKIPNIQYPTGDNQIVSTGLAIGLLNKVSNGGGLAIGTKNQVSGSSYSLALGQGNVSSDYFSVTLGIGNLADKHSSIAIGVANKAQGIMSIAMGRQSYATGNQSTAIGYIATATAKNSVALGSESKSAGIDNIAIGSKAVTGQKTSPSLDGRVLLGGGQIAIGKEAFTDAVGSIAIGAFAKTGDSQNFGLAIGGYAKAVGNSAIAIGRRSEAILQNATAIGSRGTQALGAGSTALGSGAIAKGLESSALGAGLGSDLSKNKTIAEGAQSLALGTASRATKTFSTAIGGGVSEGDHAIAIGKNATASAKNALSFGIDSRSNLENSVSIGSGAITSKSSDIAYLTGQAAVEKNGVISVGRADAARRIQQVADGSSDLEAVNVRQLKKAQSHLESMIGSSAKNVNGNITTTNIAGTGQNTIDGAIRAVKTNIQGANNSVSIHKKTEADGATTYQIGLSKSTQDGLKAGQDAHKNILEKGLTFRGNSGLTEQKKLGEQISIIGDKSGNITTIADNDGLKLALSKNLNLTADGNITIGNVHLKNDTIRIGEVLIEKGSAIGLKNRVLTHQDFAKVGRAATEEQLKLVANQTQATQNEVVQKLDGLSKNTNDALLLGQAVQKSVLEKGLTFSADTGQTHLRKLGDQLSIIGDDSNIRTIADGDNLKIQLAKNLNLSTTGRIIIGNMHLRNNALQVGETLLEQGSVKGLNNTTLTDPNFATTGRAATEEQLQLVSNQHQVGQKEALKKLDGLTKNTNKALQLSQENKNILLEKGITFQGNNGNTGQKKLGDQLSIVGDQDGNITTVADQEGLKLALSKNLNLTADGSLKIGNIFLKNNTIQIGDTLFEQGSIKGLKNKTLADSNFAKTGRAATEEQLKLVSDAQGVASKSAVSYVVNQQTGDVNYNKIVLRGEGFKLTTHPENNKWMMTGGTSISNLASAGDYTNKANANKAVNAGDLHNAIGHVIGKGIILQANSGVPYRIALDEAITFKGAEKNTDFNQSDQGKNIYTKTKPGGEVLFGLARNIELGAQGSILIGTTNIRNNYITGLANTKWDSNNVQSDRAATEGQLQQVLASINQKGNQQRGDMPQYDKKRDGSTDTSKLTFEGSKGTKLSNVAPGDIGQNSKDVVNGGQLWGVQQQIEANKNNILNLQQRLGNGSSSPGLVQQGTNNADITLAQNSGGNKVNMAGKDGDRVLAGIAAGKAENDAVTVGQLNTTNQVLSQYLGGGAKYDQSKQIFQAPTYHVANKAYQNVGSAIDALNNTDKVLDQRITNLDQKIDKSLAATHKKIGQVSKQANAGIAAAMAMEPAPFVAGKYTYAAGVAHHGGESAVGMTLKRTAESGNWAVTGGLAVASEGDPSVRIGVSGVID